MNAKNSTFLLYSIFLGIISTLFHYEFGTSDQIEQLPIIYRFLDDGFLTNDFFVNSNSNYSPRYFYATFISFLANLIELPLLFFIITLLTNCLLSIVTFKTADLLFKNKKVNLLSVLLVLTIKTVAIGSVAEIYNSFLVPSGFVFPILLLSFYFLLKRKLILSLLLCGLVSIIHVLMGLEYGLLFLGIALITDLKNKEYKNLLLKLPLTLILGCFLLFNLIPYFSQENKINNELFIKIVAFFRHPHHYVLSSILTLKETLKVVFFGGVLIFGFLRWKKKTKQTYFLNVISILSILLISYVFLGWFFVEIIPNKQITTLQLFRLLDILKWIGILFIANEIVKRIPTIIFYERLNNKIKLILISSLSSILLFLAVIDYKSLETNFQFKNYLTFAKIDSEKQQIVDFLYNNTSKESVLLSPPNFGFLRVRAKRAIVVDYKAFPFQNKAILEWYSRIENCYGLDKVNFEQVYKNHTTEKLISLKEKYMINYSILYLETETSLPIIFSNKKYKIVTLEP